MMQLDDLIVICLALLFFGGIIYLALRERKQEGSQNTESTIPPQPEPPPTPQPANGAKERRKKRKRRNR